MLLGLAQYVYLVGSLNSPHGKTAALRLQIISFKFEMIFSTSPVFPVHHTKYPITMKTLKMW